MVNIKDLEEAKRKIGEQERRIQEAERRFREEKQKIEKFRPEIKLTRVQLQKATPTSQARIRALISKRRKSKIKALSEIKKKEEEFKKKISPIKSKIQEIKAKIKEAEEWEKAKKWADKPVPLEFFPKSLAKKIRIIRADRRAYEKAMAEYESKIRALESQGLKPVYEGGKLVGFEDVSLKVSVPAPEIPEYLTKYRPEAIPSLEKAEIIKIEEIPAQKIDLKMQPVLFKKDDRLDISAGLSDRIYNWSVSRDDTQQHVRDTGGGFLAALLAGGKKGFEEEIGKKIQYVKAITTEYYKPKLTTGEKILSLIGLKEQRKIPVKTYYVTGISGKIIRKATKEDIKRAGGVEVYEPFGEGKFVTFPSVLQASTKKQNISFKRDILGPSGAYYIIPYISQETTKLIRKIPMIRELEEKAGLHKPVTSIKSPIIRSGLRFMHGFAVAAPVFTFFSPAMTTAAAGEEEASLEFWKKKQKGKLIEVEKTTIPTKSLKPYISKMEQFFKEGGSAKVRAWFRKLMTIYRQQKTAIGRETARRNIELLLKKATERGFIKNYQVDFNRGYIFFMEEATPITIVSEGGAKSVLKPKQLLKQKVETKLISKQPPKLTQLPKLESLVIRKTEVKQSQKPIQLKSSLLIQKQRQRQAVVLFPRLSQRMAQKQMQKQEQMLKLEQSQIPKLKQPQATIETELIKTRPITKPGRRVSKQPYEPTYPTPKPPIRKPKITTKSKVLKSALKKLAKGYAVYGKKKGKWKRISPFALPKEEAIAYGGLWARKGLQATFKLVPVQEKVVSLGLKPSKKLLEMFRQYKIKKGRKIPTPLQFIQKARFRLGTKSEVKEILKAKKMKGGLKVKKIKWL